MGYIVMMLEFKRDYITLLSKQPFNKKPEVAMKRTTLFTCVLTFLVFSQSFSQTEENAYLQIDYLKTDVEHAADFEKLVKKDWKAVYKKQMETAKITGWYFYKVLYPGGEAGAYNYLIITTFNDLNPVLEIDEAIEDQLTFTHSNKGSQMDVLATRQFSELWKTEAEIMSISDKKMGKIMVMNYMQVAPGKEAEYLTLENDMARPLHEERINNDEMHSWRAFSLMQPGGLNYGYNFATADYFENLSDVEYGFTNELIKSVMPGTNINEMFDAIYSTRDIAKYELWLLVDHME